MSVTVKRTVTILVTTMLLSVLTILILIAIRPLPLPFLSSYIRNQLDNRFHAYYVDFDSVQTRWRPISGTLEFHLNSARALDYGDIMLASVPKVLAEVSLDSIFQEQILIKGIEFQNPKISFIRTVGGALKFDIGSTDDGSSGRILETILIYVATVPAIFNSNQESITDLRILDSDLTLGDEKSGSLLHVPNANITLIPNAEGVGCAYDFNVLARSENLHISGECLYKTANEKLNLLVNLDEVRPALLTEISPQFSYLTPLEVRLSGEVKLELDKLLTIKKAEFDLTSGKGTLELIEHFGKNLDVKTLHIVGKILNDFSKIELNSLVLSLEEEKAEANAIFLRNDDTLDIKVNALLSGSSITKLLPRWFAYLENENLDCINSSPSNSYTQSSLTFDGTYDIKQHQINALGRISCLEQKLVDNDTNLSPSTNIETKTDAMQRFRMDGAFESPNLTTIQ